VGKGSEQRFISLPFQVEMQGDLNASNDSSRHVGVAMGRVVLLDNLHGQWEAYVHNPWCFLVCLQEWDKIWTINKRIIDPVAPRHTAIVSARRVPVTITGATGPTAHQCRSPQVV
jgi:hypothetical protein